MLRAPSASGCAFLPAGVAMLRHGVPRRNPRDRRFLAALSNRVLELTPDGIHQYGGGYTEYVARSGHEAPGLRS